MNLRRGVVFVVLCVACFPLVATEDRVFSPKLWEVQRIRVGAMGETDEGARFRRLLEDELAKKRFTVVAQPEVADAVLTGALLPRSVSDSSLAGARVELQSPAGERLWGGDFRPRGVIFKHVVKDTARVRAAMVAGALRKDWQASAKAAGYSGQWRR